MSPFGERVRVSSLKHSFICVVKQKHKAVLLSHRSANTGRAVDMGAA